MELVVLSSVTVKVVLVYWIRESVILGLPVNVDGKEIIAKVE